MGGPGRERNPLSWVVGALALVVRVALWLEARGLPAFAIPVLDSRFYVETAQALAHGGSLPPRPFFMSPGYTGFVALAATFMRGVQDVARARQLVVDVVVVLQILADVATCVLVARMAARRFGSAAGWAAGLLLALHGAQLLFTTRVLDATLGALLVAGIALACERLERGRSGRRFALLGVLVGLLALLRSTALLFAVPIGAFAMLPARRTAPSSWRRRLAHAAAFFGALLVPIVPVTLRNWLQGGEPVLLTSSGGVNFFIGNAPGSDGRFTSLNNLLEAPGGFVDDPTGGQFEQSALRYAEAKSGRKLTASEASAFYSGLARTAIAADPVLAAKRYVRKLWLFANGFEVPQVDNLYFLARYVPWLMPLAASSRLLWPLALFGMLVVARHSRPPLLVALFAIHAATIAAFFVTDRYRLWMTPIAALYAGGGVAALVAAFRTAPLRMRVGEIALLAALGFLCNLNPALFDPTARAEDRARDRGGLFRPAPDYVDLRAQHNNLAARLRESGDAAAALVECEAGLALAPDDPTLHLNLALTLEQLGTELYRKEQYAQARPLLERWTGEAPRNPEAWNTLGATLLKLDEPAAGIDAIRRATTLAPNERRYRYNLGLALVRTKHFDEGATVLDAILATDPDNAGALLARAEADVERGDFAAARPRLLRVLARNPKNSRAADLLRRCGG